MGGGKGGGGSSKTVQTTEPWKQQKPYLLEMFGDAQKLYQGGGMAPEYYPGDTVAAQDPWTTQAIGMQADRALAGSSAIKSAQDQLTQTMSGDYLTNNPFMNAEGNPQLDAMVRRAQNQTLANVAGNFSQAGRYGSGAHQAAAQDAAGNIATQMYGQAYDQDQNRALSAWNQERENQMRGMMFAPSLADQDYKDIAALSEAGLANENYAQNLINADIDKYNYEAGRPLTGLQNYGSLIQGNYGMSGSSTAGGGGKSNPLGNVASGALTGGGLGAMAGMAGLGVGAIPGAVLGGILGLF